MEGRLEAIWIKRARRGPMDRVDQAELRAGRGILGNANQRGRRQVTLIEREVWQAHMQRLGSRLDPSTRRANLMIAKLALAGTRGRVLRVGECRLRILGETKPCERMEEALAGLKDVMWPAWGGGAFAEVLEDGQIATGDRTVWEDPSPQLPIEFPTDSG